MAAVATTLGGGTSGLEEALGREREGSDPLTRAIAVTTFRRLGTIRDAMAERLSEGLPADPRLFALLATAVAQILFLDVPDHAAVDLAVRVARSDPRTRHLAGLVNAVLRRIARERDAILANDDPLRDLPDWLRDRWGPRFGTDRLRAIAEAHREGAPLDLTCRNDPAGWAERLDGALLATGTVRLADRRPVAELPGYGEGAWWVQDAAAALPARILAAKPGERVLDLCAAPGGKTAQLAAAGASVTALDRSAPRLRRLRENLGRLGLEAEVVCADALAYRPAEPFDAILIDAPCSATGTIRRHPDVAWTKTGADLGRLVALGGALLDRAVGMLKPGGRLVFCVCSLELEEGEEAAEAALARHPDLRRRPVDIAALGLGPDCLTGAGDLRTVPDGFAPPPVVAGRTDVRGGLDGFFACELVRQT